MKSTIRSIMAIFSVLSALNPIKHLSKKPKDPNVKSKGYFGSRSTYKRNTFASSRQFHYFSRKHYKLN